MTSAPLAAHAYYPLIGENKAWELESKVKKKIKEMKAKVCLRLKC